MLCLGGVSDEPVKASDSNVKWFVDTRYFEELDRIDGEPMEFEWKIFSRFITTWRMLDEIQKTTSSE